MKFYENISAGKKENLQIGLLILTLLPFLILYYFNHPTTEDFYFGETANTMSFTDAQRFFLKFWGGRYTYFALISINPLVIKSITGYNVLLLLMMTVFFIIIFLFVSEFTRESLTSKERLLFSLTIIFLYLYDMPSVSQGFYCLGFSFNYHLSIILMLLFFIAYKHLRKSLVPYKKIIYSLICGISAIAIAGCNELSAVIFLMSIVLLLLRDAFTEKKINRDLLVFVLITTAAIYLAFTSPGNSHRSQEYTDNHRFFFSIYNSGTFLLQEVISWTFNSPILAFTFLLTPYLFKIVKSNTGSDFFSIKPVHAVILLLFFLFTGIFILMWSVGILPYDRILNVLYFLFLIGWFYNMITLFYYLTRKFSINAIKFPGYLNAIAYIIIAIFLIRENNIRTAFSDIVSGDAQKYSKVMNERYIDILQDKSEVCEIDSIEYVPKSFFFMDITQDSKSVYNKGYALYFDKKSITLRKKTN